MFVAFHQLSLPAMFAVIALMCIAVCWVAIGVVRWVVPRLGVSLAEPLPIRESLINACGAMFALIVAFSAAGIWNDAAVARDAIQREANAIENAMLLTKSLPAEARLESLVLLSNYVHQVLQADWPAMRSAQPIDAPAFARSEQSLLAVIAMLSRQEDHLGQLSTYAPLLQQLLNVRQARLSRLAAATAGISWAQWFAMWTISTITVLAISLCNCHAFGMQVTATHLYALAASAAYLVIFAHDWPFVGRISVAPIALRSLLGPE